MTSPHPALRYRDYSVSFGSRQVTRDVSFDLVPGSILALVGESGSGKSVTALAPLGLVPGASESGSVLLCAEEGTAAPAGPAPASAGPAPASATEGVDLVGLDQERLRAIRGERVGVVFQEPMSAFNPMFRVGHQIAEAVRAHTRRPGPDLGERVVRQLRTVGLRDPEQVARAFPHELSGGQLQRAMIALATINSPQVLIADEPTTALDVTIQAEILALLRELRDRRSLSIMLITHDMGVIADMADRVVVMKDGQVMETAETHALFAAPEHPYTRKLLDAVPQPSGTTSERVPVTEDVPAALEVQDLVVQYNKGWRRAGFTAVNGVSFTVPAGTVVGLVGESGSGKSTIGKAVVGLAPITSGSIRVGGVALQELRGAAARAARETYGMVFQDPASSLNPRMTIGECIAEPLVAHRQSMSRAARRARVVELLEQVELPASWRTRFPNELSGGQRQRVGIARALALEPELLIADEPTSALDVSVQAAVLDVFQGLQQRLGFSCLFISHDLAVVELLAENVVVLQHGEIVEQGDARTVLNAPQTDYTRRLVAAAPLPDPVRQRARHLTKVTTV